MLSFASLCPEAMTECHHLMREQTFINNLVGVHACERYFRSADETLVGALNMINLTSLIPWLESTRLYNLLPGNIRCGNWYKPLLRDQVQHPVTQPQLQQCRLVLQKYKLIAS